MMRTGPRRNLNGAPDIRFMIFPTSEVEIIDNWHVAGLRGTGSCDFQINDLFVPEEYALAAFAANQLQPGPPLRDSANHDLRRVNTLRQHGNSRAAIDAFVALAEEKTPMGSSSRLREKPMAQADLGRAKALLRSGRAFLFEAIGEIWDESAAGRTPATRHSTAGRCEGSRDIRAGRRPAVQCCRRNGAF